MCFLTVEPYKYVENDNSIFCSERINIRITLETVNMSCIYLGWLSFDFVLVCSNKRPLQQIVCERRLFERYNAYTAVIVEVGDETLST